MKKILLSTVFALLFVANVHANPPAYGRMTGTNTTSETKKFGVKFEPHSSYLISKNDENSIKNNLGRLSFDVFGEYSLSDRVGLQLSLGYSGQGAALKVKLGRIRFENKTLLNGVMLSVMSRFYPGIDRQFCFFIGPRFIWWTSGKMLGFVDGKKSPLLVDGKEVEELDMLRVYKRVDAGIILGLDYEFDAGILLGLNSNVGIKNLEKEDLGDYGCKTFSAGIILGYNFAKLFN